MAIHIIEEREATAEERQEAQQQANKQLEPVGEQERQNLKEQNTYVAVPVDESDEDGTQEVMVVDPVTGEPVNDTVYVVDASDPNASSGEKVDLGGGTTPSTSSERDGFQRELLKAARWRKSSHTSVRAASRGQQPAISSKEIAGSPIFSRHRDPARPGTASKIHHEDHGTHAEGARGEKGRAAPGRCIE